MRTPDHRVPAGPAGPAGAVTDDVVGRLRAAGCVFAEEEAELLLEAARAEPAVLEGLLARRVAGEPLEHVLGWVELAGRRWSVGPGVFVPRRRSELLVTAGLDALRFRAGAARVVVDLCCGCGAVGGAVAAALRAAGTRVELHGADIDPAAAEHARRNLLPLGGVVHVGDLFDALPRALAGRVEVLLCHAPYVPTHALATMPADARDHEPRVALDGGGDGLDVVRRVAAQAPAWLAPGGALLVETAGSQARAAVEVMAGAGLVASVVLDDDEDAPAGPVVVGTRPV
ncbi:putative protein N(5)-glutamine methyltransferase [Isoptericola jiangsuensis]|uniref:putative protein N(5)-glutamine methyltransferase n=1 Tax=Isoptericola jiangsuensis TaxID=548579 RepID=UPI003AB0BD69